MRTRPTRGIWLRVSLTRRSTGIASRSKGKVRTACGSGRVKNSTVRVEGWDHPLPQAVLTSGRKHFRDPIDFLIQTSQIVDGVVERHRDNSGSAERGHVSPAALANHLVCRDSKAGCQNPIERRGRAAALNIS